MKENIPSNDIASPNLKKIMLEREQYYSNTFVLFEILRALKDKELAFLSVKGYEPKKAFRYMWSNNLDYLKSHMKWVSFFKFPLNIYSSVATMKHNVPVFTYNLKERKNQEQYQDFNENFKDYINGYMCFFDFDGKEDFGKCYEDAKRFKQILDDYKLPYYVNPSSFKGIHFTIPSEFMPQQDINKTLYELNIIIRVIKKLYAFETLDEMVIDAKRLKKCLTGNMPLIIKERGYIKVVTFEELAERFLGDKNHRFCKIEGVEVLSWNREKSKIEWDKLEYLIKKSYYLEGVNKIRKITTDNGFFTETTNKHRLLKWNEKTFFEFKSVIKKKDILLSPYISLNGNMKRIDLLPFILEYKDKYCFRCSVMLSKEEINKHIKKANLGYLISRDLRNSPTLKIQELIALNIPLNKIKSFSIDNQKMIGRYINIDKYFMRLLGFYVSEGCVCNKSKGIDRMGFAISIGKEYENEVKECIRGMNFKPYVYKDKRKGKSFIRKITANHRLLALVMSDFLKSGDNSYSKQIPSIIWNVPKKMQIEFLKAIIAGDGNVHKKRISYFSVSQKLAGDMVLLLKSLNFSPNVRYQLRKPYGIYIVSFSINQQLDKKKDIFSKSISENIKLHKGYKQVPITMMKKLFKQTNFKNFQKYEQLTSGKRATKSVAQRTLKFIEGNKLKRWGDDWTKYNFIKKTINNPLGYSYVKNVRFRKRSKKEYVYDITTKKNKNFISGIGGLVHHNCAYSMSCDGCVCIPLDDKMFNNLLNEKLDYINVISKIKLKERGLIVRTHDCTNEQLKQNVIRFLDEHKI